MGLFATVDVDYDHRATPRRFDVAIRLGGDLTDEQLERLETVARACPLRRSIEAGAEFEETIECCAGAATHSPAGAGGGQ